MTTDTSVSAKQPSINAPGHVLSIPDTPRSPSFPFKFQIHVANFGPKEVSSQISLSSCPELLRLTSLFRHARLLSAKAIITPFDGVVSLPITVDLAWVSANSPASPTDILKIYGGSSYTFGGAINSTRPIELPLPINSVNDMLKDSVSYLDTPKLLVFSPAPAKATSVTLASPQISGEVLCSSQLLQAL
ncbi:virion protein [Wild cucumber mosaic virus]|uniref:Capsid protein n=1 Tax=Wild cucumber mosaic virus TaxID=70824 RepID=O89518_9VIRU|nr:virion protein [Wild cucumber mosaic virus]AAC25018.1 virion protein [Wild cucumber mosaic virus]